MWLIKKVHTYAGLLTFVNLMVYGIVGLSVTLLRQAGNPSEVVRYHGFIVQPNRTDREVAEQICALLRLSLATPVHSFAIQHDAAGNLLLDLRHANGRHEVTVLEKEGRIRVAETRNSLAHYLFTLHETTAAFHSDDWRMQFWADYNEFAMWCLLAMIVSGSAMFLGVRSGSRLGQIWLVAGCCAFAVLYWWTR
jgi:hypothetical protein